ncbi:MAG: adenosylmethionine decarboxylase [Candidatus Njordarchaeum guaymaensis]
MLGKHLIIELHGVDSELLNDIERLKKILIESAITAGATIIGQVFHKFSPHGVTGIIAVKESHLSIHTWPEFNYAALDIFTCRGIDPNIALEVIIEKMKPKYYFTMNIQRGEPYTEEVVYDESEAPNKDIIEHSIVPAIEDKNLGNPL